jgi:predicted SAM-dependent methyltransferase
MSDSEYTFYNDLPKVIKDVSSFPTPYSIEIASGNFHVQQPTDKWIHTDCCLHNSQLEENHLEMLCYSWHIPLGAGTCKELIARGFWEHLSYHEVGITLKEWARVLIPGGVAIFNYPPVDHAIHMLTQKHADLQWFLRAIYGWQFQERDIHRSGWTEEWFRKYMSDRADFVIEEVFWGDSRAEDGIPRRADYDPWVTVGAHQWVILRRL